MFTIGVDVGGTYTDVVYETRSGGTAFGTGSSSQVTAVAAGESESQFSEEVSVTIPTS